MHCHKICAKATESEMTATSTPKSKLMMKHVFKVAVIAMEASHFSVAEKNNVKFAAVLSQC